MPARSQSSGTTRDAAKSAAPPSNSDEADTLEGAKPRLPSDIDDAENDRAFLRDCGCAAAVANALPAVKKAAHINLTSDHGEGVIELIERICHEDASLAPVEAHSIFIGGRDAQPERRRRRRRGRKPCSRSSAGGLRANPSLTICRASAW
jgi:hypothetical protein